MAVGSERRAARSRSRLRSLTRAEPLIVIPLERRDLTVEQTLCLGIPIDRVAEQPLGHSELLFKDGDVVVKVRASIVVDLSGTGPRCASIAQMR
jgi:hypothetical protein